MNQHHVPIPNRNYQRVVQQDTQMFRLSESKTNGHQCRGLQESLHVQVQLLQTFRNIQSNKDSIEIDINKKNKKEK